MPNVADAVREGAELPCPPNSIRSGKVTQSKQYPWYELSGTQTWILKLVIFRLLGYKGEYQIRTILSFKRTSSAVDAF